MVEKGIVDLSRFLKQREILKTNLNFFNHRILIRIYMELNFMALLLPLYLKW